MVATTLILGLACLAPSPPAKPPTAAPAQVVTAPAVKQPRADSVLAGYHKIAMMPLSSLGSTEDAARSIQRVLDGEVQKLLTNRLVSPSVLQGQGPHVKAALDTCQGLIDCLVEVFGGLGWDAFIVGNVAGIGEGRVINLKLIDVRSAKELRRASEKASGEEKQLIANIRRAAVELLAPELFVGKLEINAAQPNVNIVIDGQLAGRTPLADATIPLTVGRHAIEANGEGLVPFTSFVDIAYGESVPVKIDLPANSLFIGGRAPFRSRWWTWVAASVGVVGLGVGTVFNVLQVQNVHDINQQAKNHQLGAGTADLYSQSKANWSRAAGFYIGGGVVLGTVGILYTIDLF